MIRSHHFDVYVASCTSKGGIYHYKMCDGHLEFAEVTFMDRPMYMVINNKKMYVVLRAPFENEESGVVVYDIDNTGKLINPSQILSTKGVVSCHIMVNDGYIYCANYLSGSLIEYKNKQLKFQDICTIVPSSFQGESTAAAIRVKEGFIYVSNRGHDSITKLSFNGKNIAYEDSIDCGGKTPRDFLFVGDNLLCANQDSDCVVLLDGVNGFRIKEKIYVETPTCICLDTSAVSKIS